MRHSIRAGLAIALALLALSGAAGAQIEKFPSKPIQVISTAPPGAQSDVLLRFLAAEVSRSLGQQMIVISRASAAGTIGAEQAKRSAPDGHTLFFGGNTTMAVNVHLFKSLAYDPLKDFDPITLVTTNPLVLVVKSSLPIKSVADFVAYAKARPGELNYGVGNSGNKVAVSLLESLTGMKTTEITFPGASQAMLELVAGRLDFIMSDPLVADPQIKKGAIRALAVTAPVRLPSMSALPSMSEAGIAGYIPITTFLGMYAPHGTPRPVILALNDAFVKAINSKEGRDQLDSMGMVGRTSTPEELAAFTKEQIGVWQHLVKISGLQPQ